MYVATECGELMFDRLVSQNSMRIVVHTSQLNKRYFVN